MADLFTKLPIEIIFDILSRLPLKTISNCRWVSKSWYDFILNPNFAKLHFSKFKHDFPFAIFPSRYQRSYLIDPESLSRYETFATAYNLNFKNFRENFTISNGWNCFEVVGTVNGLVCFSPELCDYEPNPYYIVNPITREYVLLSKSPKIDLEPIASGFGFDSRKDEYKLVRILYNSSKARSEEEYEYARKRFKKCVDDETKDEKYGNTVEIYTLGSGTWREVQLTMDVPSFTVTCMMRQSNVCVNGCLHWTPLVDIDSKEYGTIILSFDLSKEEFNLIQIPSVKNLLHLDERRTFELIVLCEQLCLVDGEFMDDKDVWVMKSYGVHSSWVKEYVFKEEVISCSWHGFHEVMELKNNELLLVNKKLKLSYYDRKNIISKPIMLHDLEGNKVKVDPDFAVYLQGSILSPKAIECVQ